MKGFQEDNLVLNSTFIKKKTIKNLIKVVCIDI